MTMERVLFPAFLDLVGRRVLLVGGGRVAGAKLGPLLQAGAHVTVVSPLISPEIDQMAVDVRRRPFEPEDVAGCWYVVSAAPPAVNAQVAREATARGIFVNAVDDPRHATAFAGSVFKRGPVTVALSTGGTAPALARVLREALERLVGRDVEAWAWSAARVRADWRREQVPMEERRNGLLAMMARLHEESLGSRHARRGRATQSRTSVLGLVSLVGAGPGDPELLTRRAAHRLAEADLVLYDSLVAPATVSLAVRAQRILVGRRQGSATAGQDAINRTMIRAARRGRRVVRLKGGDPFVFGRGGEEALALAGAGVPFEIVPGVSSAFAAPALASIPVTHRGLSSAVLVTTGHDVERLESLLGSVAPGSLTLVVLMGTGNRLAVQDALIQAGWSPATPSAIVWDASMPDAHVWSGPLGDLSDAEAPGDRPGTIVVGTVVALGQVLAEDRARDAREVCHG